MSALTIILLILLTGVFAVIVTLSMCQESEDYLDSKEDYEHEPEGEQWSGLVEKDKE